MYHNQNRKNMRDLHDPNNPEYQKEVDTPFRILLSELREEDVETILDEVSTHEGKANVLKIRMRKIKKELNELIEVCENTEQTYILNKLKTIVNY